MIYGKSFEKRLFGKLKCPNKKVLYVLVFHHHYLTRIVENSRPLFFMFPVSGLSHYIDLIHSYKKSSLAVIYTYVNIDGFVRYVLWEDFLVVSLDLGIISFYYFLFYFFGGGCRTPHLSTFTGTSKAIFGLEVYLYFSIK